MTNKAERTAIKILVAKHLKFYGAPVGQRKCKHNVSENCLDVDSEKQFEGHMCKQCVKHRQNDFYNQRMVRRGEAGNPVRDRVGRPRKVIVEEAIVSEKKVTQKKKKKVHE